MQANWSLILNVLLLVGVIVAIGRLMKARRRSLTSAHYQPDYNQAENQAQAQPSFNDDIIAVRKVNRDSSDYENTQDMPQLNTKTVNKASQPRLMPQAEPQVEIKAQPYAEKKPTIRVEPDPEPQQSSSSASKSGTATSLMMFLLAKDNRQFAGYELLQTVLAAGLRFGEGHLFHRHQFVNGQGPVLCSLAAATASGVFDLQNIGAFSVRGLCLFMQASKNPSIDAERFAIMLETARQLSDGLDAHLLDDTRHPLTQERIARYYRLLNIEPVQEECEVC